MGRASFTFVLFLCALLLGAGTAIFIIHHPFVTSADLGDDSLDAKASFRVCRLYASWPVELKRGEPLILERRVCPAGFHSSDDDEDWSPPAQHEVLLLESRNWWHVKVVSAKFSDLDYVVVDVGKTVEDRDAVLWSYFIKCGSCHGGPNGVLAWSDTKNSYLWNEKWFDPYSESAQAKLPESDYPDSPITLTWVGSKTELEYDAAVYGESDAHCCPNGGHLEADFVVEDGIVKLKDQFTFLPSP
jgi:hypothetical protein